LFGQKRTLRSSVDSFLPAIFISYKISNDKGDYLEAKMKLCVLSKSENSAASAVRTTSAMTKLDSLESSEGKGEDWSKQKLNQ